MSRTKSCWAVSAVLLLAGCGGGGKAVELAGPQVAHLNWREAGDPHNLLGGPIVYRVRSLRIGPRGWTVAAAVVNDTKEPLRIVYGHEPAGHNDFGIRVGEAPGRAEEFRPAVPILLRPGEGWSGTFSAPDRLARGTLVRVQFGQFGTLHGDRWTWVTDHAYRVR
jgi:hypothetical protein